jgi:hypothetical protein
LKYSFVGKYLTKSAGERAGSRRRSLSEKICVASCVDLKNEVTRWKPKTLSYAQSDRYAAIAVAPNLYAHKTIAAQIVDAIKTSALRDKKEYVYSDLSYYLLPRRNGSAHGRANAGADCLSETFCKPLGATTLVYRRRSISDGADCADGI